jgi:hypothetical protein
MAKPDLSKVTTDLMVKFADVIVSTEKQTHASIVLRVASLLEYDLERCLMAEMRELKNDFKKRLFQGYGPLSSFSSKIDLSYAFSIIDRETFVELNKLREIRNRIAHSKDLFSLGQEPVLKLFNGLIRPTGTKGTYLQVFLACAQAIDDKLERFLSTKGIKDDIRPENLHVEG